MKKVFRIHNEGALNSDWFDSLEPGRSLAKTIKDDDTKIEELPSSIPSPFARMDLVRGAFRHVNDHGLEGNTYHHKLVSDALDVGQILFNYDVHKDHLKIVRWNKNEQLKRLKNSSVPEHVQFAETLELFIKQDEHFNFTHLNDIYILKYDHQIIGGTSPLTLFFAAPFNDRKPPNERMQVHIKFGNDRMLDDEYLPLFKRDRKYIKYLFALSKTQNFSRYFNELYDYIFRSIDKIRQEDPELHDELHQIDVSAYFSSLSPLNIEGTDGNLVYALNHLPLYKHKPDPTLIQSDFLIDSEKKVLVNGEAVSPLVLPVDTFNYPLRYTQEIWDPAHPALEYDPNPIADRRLPHVNDRYPYLTLDDFLEKSLIKVPYDINANHFFSPGDRYLLPLKETFFDFFSPDVLQTRKLLEIITHGNSVEVNLRIPITGNDQVKFIKYRRLYKKPSTVTNVGGFSGISGNSGIIKDLEFGLCVTPSIAGNMPSLQYTVGLINMNSENELNPSFYDSTGRNLSVLHHNKRLNAAGMSSNYYILESQFNLIRMNAGNSVSGFLIPNFTKYTGGNTKFTFAVDFGTSNTHIEYKTDQINASKPFQVGKDDLQLLYSFEPDKSANTQRMQDPLVQELFPLHINDGSNGYIFPMRTAILQNKNVNVNEGTHTFSHYNIAFDFEKKQIRPHLDHKTNIKWSNYRDTANRKHLEHYIEHVLIILRNKVLLNDGHLDSTRIVWFFPSSMGESKVNALNRVWHEKTEAVFGREVAANLRRLTESVAPFYFYNQELGVTAQTLPVVAIDIGGGTTDVVIYKDDKPKLITSFRFAGNAIFGDGFGGSLKTNGFIAKYSNFYREKLKSNSPNLFQVLEQLLNKGYSEDIINFLFNLATNKELNAKNVKIDFARELEADDQLKIVFLLFYTSLFYHLSELMIEAGYAKPVKVLLSGTGSKTACIADLSKNLAELAQLYNAIFDQLSRGRSQVKTQLVIESNPKEITAKGGLYSQSSDFGDLDELIAVKLGGTRQKYPLFKPHNPLSEGKRLLYADVLRTDEVLNDVVNDVVKFLEIFLQLSSEFNFHRKFGVSQYSIKLLHSLMNGGRHELMDDIKRGLQDKQKEVEDAGAATVDETLFFYPLIGMLNRLAKQSIEGGE